MKDNAWVEKGQGIHISTPHDLAALQQAQTPSDHTLAMRRGNTLVPYPCGQWDVDHWLAG